ncbi:MAG TPA: SCO family protein [Caulobacteraceae bacterium]|nr:SCO family protein [Caulobacteraceae bacterium]
MRPAYIPYLTAAVCALGLAVAGCGPSPYAGVQDQASGQPLIGGPFQLIDQDGRPVNQSALDGKWTAVFFGYTYCPDVCPTTLTTLGEAQTELGAKAKDFQVVFITVDPARDTPSQLKAYLSSPVFPKGTLGLTGAPAQVDQAAKAYKVFYQKEGSGNSYVMDHSSAIYLMDPHGKFDRVLAENLKPDETAHQISDAMAEGPKSGA